MHVAPNNKIIQMILMQNALHTQSLSRIFARIQYDVENSMANVRWYNISRSKPDIN